MTSGIKRLFLAAVMLLTLTSSFAQATGLTGGDNRNDRTLKFYNTHTRENMVVTYWRNGHYDHDALDHINTYLRDHRSGHVHEMNFKLMNLLYDLGQQLHRSHPDVDIVFNVISGYRSPKTNAMLRANGGGQAKNSQHMYGNAIDIRVPGIDISEIRDTAWCMQRGGVGYYRGSDFVHVDVSRVRYWNWAPKPGMCGRGNS